MPPTLFLSKLTTFVLAKFIKGKKDVFLIIWATSREHM
jgi:hypothetical protein